MYSRPRITFSNVDDHFIHYPVQHMQTYFPHGHYPLPHNEIISPVVHGDRYVVTLNMQQFEPAEVSVKYDDGKLIVHGKREKKGEDGTLIYREYKQICNVPENVLHEQMICKLNTDGVLRIEAPLKTHPKDHAVHHIPIEFVNANKK